MPSELLPETHPSLLVLALCVHEQLLSVCVLLLTVIIIVELVWANKGSPV